MQMVSAHERMGEKKPSQLRKTRSMRGTNSGKQRLAVHLRRNEGKVLSAQFTSVNDGWKRKSNSFYFFVNLESRLTVNGHDHGLLEEYYILTHHNICVRNTQYTQQHCYLHIMIMNYKMQ